MTQTASAPPQPNPKPKRTRRTEQIIAQVSHGEGWLDLESASNSTESARDSIIRFGLPEHGNLPIFRIIRIVEDGIKLESRVTIAKPERKRRNNNPA